MNPVLSELAKQIQLAAARFIPLAYALGRKKAAKKYGVKPWGEKDNVNVTMLLNRHAEELAQSMARIEESASQGESLSALIGGLINRAGSWSWALSPAVAMGLASYVDDARQDIAEVEGLPAANIGIIWYTAEDARVCKRCLYLSGRWFDAKEAYALASTIHRNCRCSAHFDVGTPDEALVGPIPGYKPGTAQDVYRDLHVDGLVSARDKRAREIIARGKPKEYARPNV